MYFKKRGCFSGREKTVNVWVWIFLRFFFRRLEDLEDSRKEMYGQYEDPRCFKSVFRIDSFLSTAISKFHIPVYTMCAVIISLFVLLSRLFGRAAISDLFYIQFLSSESPSRLCHSLERVKCLEEYRWKWRTLSFTFDKEHRRKWPFNGNLEERERERRPDTTLHELLSSAGFGLSLWNLFELFTRAGYTRAPCMPQDAAIILRNASVTPTIPRVMSSTIHSQMARNPILSLPCTNLALCARVGKFIGATLSTC